MDSFLSTSTTNGSPRGRDSDRASPSAATDAGNAGRERNARARQRPKPANSGFVLRKIAELHDEALNIRLDINLPPKVVPTPRSLPAREIILGARSAMSERDLYLALLQPCVLHILRAAGFHAARPAALESLVHLTAQFLEMLARKSKEMAESNHNGHIPNQVDVRGALEYAGVLKPAVQLMEEQLYGDDDLRGVGSFVSWAEGPQAKEIRRVAGLEEDDAALNVEGDVREDYLTALMKKHSKTGNEERFRGTMLGGDLPPRNIIIEGPGPKSIAAFHAKLRGDELPEDQEDTKSC